MVIAEVSSAENMPPRQNVDVRILLLVGLTLKWLLVPVPRRLRVVATAGGQHAPFIAQSSTLNHCVSLGASGRRSESDPARAAFLPPNRACPLVLALCLSCGRG